MPFGDHTGPQGQGPMTGRGMGYCAGYDRPGYMNPAPGRGYFGWGRGYFGGGHSWRNWARTTGLPGWERARVGLPAFGGRNFYPGYTPNINSTREKEILTRELQDLKEEIKVIEKRLGDLKGSKTKKS